MANIESPGTDYQAIPDKVRRVRAAGYLLVGLAFLIPALVQFTRADGAIIGGYLLLPATVGVAGGLWNLLKKQELTAAARERKESEARRAQLERDRRTREFWRGVWGWVGGLCFLTCLAILGYQVLTYLREGTWIAVSTLEIPALLGSEWANSPTTWLGLHKIMERVPLTVTLFILSAALISYSETD